MAQKGKINIAVFADTLKEGLDGVSHTLHHIIKRIPRDRGNFVFITAYPPSKHVRLPVPVHTIPKVSFPLQRQYPLALPFLDSRLKRLLADFRPDLIHTTTPSVNGCWALTYGMRHGIPVTSMYHTHFPTYFEYYLGRMAFPTKIFEMIGWKYLRWFYNNCQKTYVPTEIIVDELVGNSIERQRLDLWGRGVDTTCFSPVMKDEGYINKMCGDKKKILFVSRLVWEKEIETLISVYEQFDETRPDFQMIVTGSGPCEKMMKKRMPHAVFTGALRKTALAKIYASSDAFIFPSVTETFGNVVLESLSSGLVPVVAAAGGPKGIIQNGVNGFHAEPKNAKDFCRKLEFLLDNDRLRKKMSKNAVAFAETQQWDNLCQRLFHSIEGVVASHKKKKKPA